MNNLFIILAVVAFVHVARSDMPSMNDVNAAVAPAPGATDTAPSSGAASPVSDTCTASVEGTQQTFQPGARYCLDEKTHRVCNWGGVWIDNTCPEDSKCQKLPGWKVQCFALRRNANPPATGPQGGDSDSADTTSPKRLRFVRQADNSSAPASAPASTKSDICTASVDGTQQTFQPGDRYCLDEKTHRVCNWGGVWIDNICPEEANCQKLQGQGWKVQCFLLRKNAEPYATGPPSGQSEPSDVPAPQPQSQPQPQPQPASQTQSQSQPQSDSAPQPPQPQSQPDSQPASQPQPQPAPQPAPQPQPQPAPQPPTQPQAQSQPASEDNKPMPAAPPSQPKDCGDLKPGDTICSGDDGYKMCHDGQLFAEQCPSPAKCIKSPTSNHVICREIRRSTKSDMDSPKDHPRR